uniref:Uncharacterized protein n=1 Tax=uncultured bacterium BLR12 TaxID=506514 RepID=C0INF2_9BACT|nr:hypothetical protein AKSOIL_0223 [uncultured bacterium BLR12]
MIPKFIVLLSQNETIINQNDYYADNFNHDQPFVGCSNWHNGTNKQLFSGPNQN